MYNYYVCSRLWGIFLRKSQRNSHSTRFGLFSSKPPPGQKRNWSHSSPFLEGLNMSPISWHFWSRWFSELPPGILNGFPGRFEILLDFLFGKLVNVFHYGLGKWPKIQVDFLEKHLLFSWRCTCFHHLTCCVSETCALNKWIFRLGNSEKNSCDDTPKEKNHPWRKEMLDFLLTMDFPKREMIWFWQTFF